MLNLTLTRQTPLPQRCIALPAWTLQSLSCTTQQGHATPEIRHDTPETGTDVCRRRRVRTGYRMKHPSSRAFFAYWDRQRGDARAPHRSALEPGPVRELLGDIFVLSYAPQTGFPIRVAGTRVCALLGRDRKGDSFTDLFAPESRAPMSEMLGVVADELLVAVAGVSGINGHGAKVSLELLLLPFRTRAHTPLSLTGLLIPLLPGQYSPIGEMTLATFRYLAHPPQRFTPRALKKLAIARGLMVYEGLR